MVGFLFGSARESTYPHPVGAKVRPATSAGRKETFRWQLVCQS